jgi:hypothetical protein
MKGPPYWVSLAKFSVVQDEDTLSETFPKPNPPEVISFNNLRQLVIHMIAGGHSKELTTATVQLCLRDHQELWAEVVEALS